MDEYFERWLSSFHHRETGLRRIGLEVEYPVVSKTSFDQMDASVLLATLGERDDWSLITDDYYQDRIAGVERDGGQDLFLEYTPAVIEAVTPPRNSLVDIEEKDDPWFEELRTFFYDSGALLLGYGTLPMTTDPQRTKKRRYEALRRALTSTVDVIGLTASTQVSFEVSDEELVDAVNVFNALTGISVAFMANSPIWQAKDSGALAAREGVWEVFAPDRSGIPPRPFSSAYDYFMSMAEKPLIIKKRGADYIAPRKNNSIEGNVKNAEDFANVWKFHEGTVWWDARPRSVYGTIEVRPACTQPHGEHMVVAAFWLGLTEALQDAKALVGEVPWQAWRDSRKACMYNGFHAYINDRSAIEFAREVLEISEKGLKGRGLGEERFLKPLWNRLEGVYTPAEKAREMFRKGGAPFLIEYLADIN